MKETKKLVRTCVLKSRASYVRKQIQRRDQLFKSQDKNRFKAPSSANECIKLRSENGIISDESAVANCFADFFSNISSSHVNDNVRHSDFKSENARSFNITTIDPLRNDFTLDEVSDAIKVLKYGKAAGPDNILSEHIKYGGPMLASWFLKVFNRIRVIEEILELLFLSTKRKVKIHWLPLAIVVSLSHLLLLNCLKQPAVPYDGLHESH